MENPCNLSPFPCKPGALKQTIAFITAVNDGEWYSECRLYIESLEVPAGYEIELIPIEGAASMCSAYNEGMARSAAKYKVYLHQDTLILNKKFITDLLNIFENPRIGLFGVIGAKTLPSNGVWWDSDFIFGKVLHHCEAESITESVCRVPGGEYEIVDAVDGLLLATQYDIHWSEEIFDGWHFYDVSQCLNFRRAGLKVVVPRQEDFWCMHCPREKPLPPSYEHYRLSFQVMRSEENPVSLSPCTLES